MGKSVQPYWVAIGRIVGSFQALNCYDVITDFGRFQASYHGISRGPGGVMEGGSLSVGTHVWLTMRPGERVAGIIGVILVNWPAVETDPRILASYPQVAGFELGKRLVGKMYSEKLGGLINRPTDILQDFVDGEWSMTSPTSGVGVGVELFRSWIRGGAMSGLWCYGDTQLTRLAGLDFEFLTLAQEDYDKRMGNAIVSSRKRVFYPDEAVNDLLPREQEIAGAIHGGRQRFLAPQGPRGVARPALFHEHLATDGSWSVTSAGGIFLQKYCGLTVPEESAAPVPEDGSVLLADQPVDADAVRQAALIAPRPAVEAPVAVKTGLAWVHHTLDLITSLTQVRARGGFDRLPVQWPAGTPSEVPEDTFHTTYDARMWRSLPQVFTIQIDPVEKGRKFYVGRSSIALNPDGSIVIEDAHHSQIIMSGGNIVLAAAHDVILAPGRSLLAIAGKDIGLRANRNIDAAANEGRVSIKAEDQLSLLGGNNGGNNGVLIESRALTETSKEGTGTDQRLGGLVLKASSAIYGVAPRIGFSATIQPLTLQSASSIDLSADLVDVRAPTGLFVYHDDLAERPGYAFTEDEAVLPGGLLITGQLFSLDQAYFDGSLVVNNQILAGGAIAGSSVTPTDEAASREIASFGRTARGAIAKTKDAVRKAIGAVAKALNTFLTAKTPLNKDLRDRLGFSFSTSKQTRYDVQFSWQIPEVQWQTIARRGDHGLAKAWKENPVRSPAGDNQPTAPMPGYEAWTGANYELNDEDQYTDLATGQVIPHEDGKEILPAPRTVKLDSNYLIGDDS